MFFFTAAAVTIPVFITGSFQLLVNVRLFVCMVYFLVLDLFQLDEDLLKNVFVWRIIAWDIPAVFNNLGLQHVSLLFVSTWVSNKNQFLTFITHAA